MAFCMSQEDFDKIIYYAEAAYDKFKTEIGGMLIAKKDENSDWIISDPVIVKQEVTAGNCTLDKDELSAYYTKMAMEHGHDIKFVWWHSHHTMGVSWSGTDTNTMEEFKSSDWTMSLVVNLKREYTFRINWWEPKHVYLDCELEIGEEDQVLIPEEITNEVNELCSTSSVQIIERSYGGHTRQQRLNSNYYGHDYYDAYGGNDYGDVYNQQTNLFLDDIKASKINNGRFIPHDHSRSPEQVVQQYIEVADEILNDAYVEHADHKDLNREWKNLQEETVQYGLHFKNLTKTFINKLMQGDIDANYAVKLIKHNPVSPTIL